MATIDAVHSIFIQEWQAYKAKLEEGVPEIVIDKMEEQEEKEPLDVKAIYSYLENLKTASEECDMDVMDEMMEKLQEYQYPGDIQADIEKLSVFVTNLDSEHIISLVEHIKGLI